MFGRTVPPVPPKSPLMAISPDNIGPEKVDLMMRKFRQFQWHTLADCTFAFYFTHRPEFQEEADLYYYGHLFLPQLTQTGASIPPEAMIHFPPVSDFPLFSKHFETLENFQYCTFSR